MERLVFVLAVIAIAAAPTSKPASRPARPDALADAKTVAETDRANLSAAQSALETARAQCLEKFRQTPACQKQAAEVERLKKSLETARAKGSAAERIEASSAHGKASNVLKKLEADALKSDLAVATAQSNVASLVTSVAADDAEVTRLERRKKHWIAKPNAPAGVAELIRMQPLLRKAAQDNSAPDSTPREIARLERELQHAQSREIPRIVAGHNAFGEPEYQPDEAAENARAKEVKALKKRLETVRAQYNGAAPKGPTASDLLLPDLVAQVGSVGKLGTVRIQQILDDDNMLIDAGNQTVWVKGYSTKGLVDSNDPKFEINSIFQITGTKRYTTVIGATTTCFVAEPCELSDFVELVFDD
jgi:hypothetical protein